MSISYRERQKAINELFWKEEANQVPEGARLTMDPYADIPEITEVSPRKKAYVDIRTVIARNKELKMPISTETLDDRELYDGDDGELFMDEQNSAVRDEKEIAYAEDLVYAIAIAATVGLIKGAQYVYKKLVKKSNSIDVAP